MCARTLLKAFTEAFFLNYHLKGWTSIDKEGKGGFKSEATGEFLHCHHKYSIAENLNFPPKTLNNLF